MKKQSIRRVAVLLSLCLLTAFAGAGGCPAAAAPLAEQGRAASLEGIPICYASDKGKEVFDVSKQRPEKKSDWTPFLFLALITGAAILVLIFTNKQPVTQKPKEPPPDLYDQAPFAPPPGAFVLSKPPVQNPPAAPAAPPKRSAKAGAVPTPSGRTSAPPHSEPQASKAPNPPPAEPPAAPGGALPSFDDYLHQLSAAPKENSPWGTFSSFDKPPEQTPPGSPPPDSE